MHFVLFLFDKSWAEKQNIQPFGSQLYWRQITRRIHSLIQLIIITF